MNKQWHYSEAAICLIQEFVTQFPELLKLVEEGKSLVFESDFEASESSEKYVNKIFEWLKSRNLDKPALISASSEAVEKESVGQIIEAVRITKIKPLRRVVLQVKPTAVLVPELNLANRPLQENMRFRLFDRVVICSIDQKVLYCVDSNIIISRLSHHYNFFRLFWVRKEQSLEFII